MLSVGLVYEEGDVFDVVILVVSDNVEDSVFVLLFYYIYFEFKIFDCYDGLFVGIRGWVIEVEMLYCVE